MNTVSSVLPSTAPDLAARDGLSALQRAMRQPLMMGLFLPIQNGGWTPTTLPRSTTWTAAVSPALAGAAIPISAPRAAM